MRRRPTHPSPAARRGTALTLRLALLPALLLPALASCATGNPDRAGGGPGVGSGGVAAVSPALDGQRARGPTAAGALRTRFTALLVEDVHLTAAAASAGPSAAGPAPDSHAVAAAGALDGVATSLADAVGAAYPDARGPFLAAWRARGAALRGYAGAGSGADAAPVLRSTEEVGALLGGVVGGLEPAAVAAALRSQTAAQLAGLDGAPTGQDAPDAAGLTALRAASGRAAATAAVLARAVDLDRGLEGDAASPAAALRAALAHLLLEHVHLAGRVLPEAVLADAGSPSGPAARPASVGTAGPAAAARTAVVLTALDAAAADLARTVTAGDPAARVAFLGEWRRHVRAYARHARARAAGDTASVRAARDELTAYRTALGGVVHAVAPGLPAGTVAAELEPHVASLLAVVDAVVAGQPARYARLREAGAHTGVTAGALATALVADRRLG